MRDATLNIALRAVDQTGKFIQQAFSHLGQHQIKEKRPNDFVSDMDIEAEKRLIEALRSTYPDHSFLAEESGEIKGAPDCEHQWVIDPIDGTNNFVRGIPHFAISVAHRFRGVTEHALIFDPVKNEMFTALRGKGAYLNGTRLRVRQNKTLQGVLLLSGMPLSARSLAPATIRVYEALYSDIQDIRMSGSAALDMAYVAAGRADAYFETQLQPWDSAAGALLIKEAGGIVTDLAGGESWSQSGSVLCGNLRLCALLSNTLMPLHQAQENAKKKAE